MHLLLQTAIAVLPVAVYYVLRRKHDSVPDFPGPESPSWLYGNLAELLLAPVYGQYEFTWLKRFGSVYQIRGCFGRTQIVIADPVAMNYVFSSPKWDQTPPMSTMMSMAFGLQSVEGFRAAGPEHRHLRGALNGAFTASVVQGYEPIFERVATGISERIDSSPTNTVDIADMLSDATLSAISLALLSRPVEELDPDFVQMNTNFLRLAARSSKKDMWSTELLTNYIPQRVIHWLLSFKVAGWHAVTYGRDLGLAIGRTVVEDKLRAQASGEDQGTPPIQKNLSSSACTAHESTISYRFPSSSGSPSPPPIIPSSPDLAHQNQPGPSNPYLALPPPEDEFPDLDELPSEQPPSPPPTAPAPTMSGHHRITLAANPPYFDGDKSKYLGFVDACTTYIGAYRSEFSLDETKILFVLSYLRNESGTSCAASRWAMNWKQHNFEGFQGLKAGVTSKNFLEELQRAFGDSNAEQVAAARLMALRQNKRSFADYISDFEMLAADAGYNMVDTTDDKGEYKKGEQDNILIEFLERGLSSEIASRLYNTGVPLPKAYGAFKNWCVNIEANALRDQLRKASHAQSAPRPPPQFRPQAAPMTPAPAPARPATNEPVPMEIDRTHARGRNIICYNCQQPGHIARNCPEPRKKRTFFNRATMLEEIENGDKDNEFLKEIAEKLREKGF
ncbi:unnamed protein product [Mycena citricolor]|uniref:CCHC-type domain-containing protein n=1 Tax=Mycena citricolor TaxID=2018698 RepID=A0AAD2Q735_9AGAR|nr:unnamed protein product [Mycena citricolor]